MSLNSIISTSLSGLFASQAALRSTANNVANVNTEHYARSRVLLEASITRGQSNGVTIGSIKRVVDEFLETALRTSTSNASEFTVQRQFHDRLQGILGDPGSDSSLSSRLDQVFQSTASLALNPADVLRRQQTLSEIQSYLDQSSVFHVQMQSLRSEASQQISENVDSINQQLQRISQLNPLLIEQAISGGDSSGLEGQLAQALAELSELVDIKIDRQASGAVHVSTGSGYPLIDSSLSQLTYNAPGLVSSGTVFQNITVARVDSETLQAKSTPVSLETHIRSGKLAGLLTMRDKQLPNLSESLGELSARVADEFNRIQNGFTAAPPPNTLTGKQTILKAADTLNFTGKVNFAVVNANNELQAKVEVDFDAGGAPTTYAALMTLVNGASGLNGSGTLALTNGVMSLSATSSTNSVAIVDDPTTPSLRAGRGFSHYFGMNDIVRGASPGIYETGLTGTETHSMGGSESISFRVVDSDAKEITTVTVGVTGTTYGDMVTALNSVSGMGAYFTFAFDSNGTLTTTPKPGYEGADFQVVTDSTQIASTGESFTSAFGLGNSSVIDASKELKVTKAIADNPTLMALSVFDLTGTTGNVVITNGDQRGALALQNLETTLVKFGDAGELKGSNVTLSQYVGRFLGNAGLQAARATNFEEDNLALQQEISKRNSDVSGVNLDEELANLIVYQNAYNAAARILSSVQKLYDTLLRVV